MTEKGGQYVLQTALAAGMSATEGLHGKDMKPVDPSFDGLAIVLPQDIVPTTSSRLTFKGKNENVEVPYISWGSWSWGDSASWGWTDDELPALQEAWKLAFDAGQGFIDNAQAYGSGESERIMGDLIKDLPRDKYQIQTKWYVVPDNLTNLFKPAQAPAIMLRESLERSGLKQIDSYLVHGHIHASSIKQVAQSLAECVDSGMTKTVGVANYSESDMIQIADELKQYGIPLAVNQCEYSVLRRYPEISGLLKACRDRGIVFQSYSSLAQGRLSGKYDENNPPPSNHRFSSYPMEELKPTLKVLEDLAQRRGKPISAIAINYNISKGIQPVVGIRHPKQVKENMQALGWRLTNDEIKELDAVSLEGKATVLWQQG